MFYGSETFCKTFIFGLVFLMSLSFKRVTSQRNLRKFAALTSKPQSQVIIVINGTWAIKANLYQNINYR